MMTSTLQCENEFTAIDLFCGCGAVTLGLKARGYKVVAAVDNDPAACGTYRTNHQEVVLYEQDIRTVEPAKLRCDLGERALDIMVVCAPCQPFSSQNHYRGDDPRAHLILESVRFATVLKPRIILYENVPGLVAGANTPVLDTLLQSLRQAGYLIGDPVSLDAADHRVPQRRKRCVLFASRIGLPPQPPEPQTPAPARITVRDAIGDLEPLSAGQSCASDSMHAARAHKPIALQRMRHISKDGGSRSELPPELCLSCHKHPNKHPDVYGRMKWADVAPTLTTGCTDITRGRFMHPNDNRAITLREAARLQTFPDDYHFFGSNKDIARQIGNAVPVRLAEALAGAVAEALRAQTE